MEINGGQRRSMEVSGGQWRSPEDIESNTGQYHAATHEVNESQCSQYMPSYYSIKTGKE